MDFRFNKSLLLILSLSYLLVSSNAIPLTRVLHIPPVGSPTVAPHMDLIDGIMSLAAKAVTKISPQISKFCTGTENPTLCAQTIAPFLDGSFDPIKALETLVNATLNHTRKVCGTITKLINDPSTSKNALDALGICKSQYDDIMDTVKEAIELIEQQNVVDAYYKFSSVIGDQSSCEDAFNESPGVNMPFAKDSQTLYQLGGNCLAIMDGIVNNSKL
ncbi:uncharacterized protein LOC133285218 [Gastrolobium bilobum]|uniref:uncharacterized protein LOC133285218 n=1 Tax=Gastrolobium bilobum TaxID=150636 RepID=UPI002AAFAAAC|nr:uncharacterized protein LOC133285218 [Gastrolobium bilobum]